MRRMGITRFNVFLLCFLAILWGCSSEADSVEVIEFDVSDTLPDSPTNGETPDPQAPDNETQPDLPDEIDYIIPIVEILADTNRNGTIDFDDPSESANKTSWSREHGAIFLANIDDDQGRCTSNGSDAALAGCHDAADEVVNGEEDLKDLARLKTRPWPDAPESALGTLTLNEEALPNVRLFINAGRSEQSASFQVFNPETDRITHEDLKRGVEFAIEGKDIIRDENIWDGIVDITFSIEGLEPQTVSPEVDLSDTVRLRQAPLIFRHHLDPAEVVYATRVNDPASRAFRDDLGKAVENAGVPSGFRTFRLDDQWTQDFFENGYMAMPSQHGKQVIQVYLRSANTDYPESLAPLYDRMYRMQGMSLPDPLREAGRVVYTDLHGPDVAGLTQYHPDKGHEAYDLTGYDLDDVLHWLYGSGQARQSYPQLLAYLERHWDSDTLDSFGNTETIPPYQFHNQSYPLGRVLRGKGNTVQPDLSVSHMIRSQGVQEPVYLHTTWLLVSHVDETISFVKADNERGWVMLLNDPALARNMLQYYRVQGFGHVPMFVDKEWPVDYEQCTRTWSGWNCPDPQPAEVSIASILDDSDIMAATARAAVEIDEQLRVMKHETRITESEIVRLPFLHESTMGALIAYQPGTVNGISLSDTHFGAPDPHGPIIDGADVFKAQMEEEFSKLSINVHWIENWDLYHVMAGEVHCGSNTRRIVPDDSSWWEEVQ